MKKISVLSLMFTLLLIVGCSKDDSNDNGDSTSDIPGNNLNLGASAEDLLGNDIFQNLEVEVVYPDGFQPQAQSLENLKSFIQARTFKTNVSITQRQISAPSDAPFSIEEIREIEANNRTAFNDESTIKVFVLFANGNSANDEGNQFTLGTAYQNTSMVIYQKTIQETTSGITAPNIVDVETTVLKHEFAHLLGLVDVGTPLQSDHKDPESDGHCITEGCLMRAQAEFASGMIGMLEQGETPNLDAACIADLQANGGR